MSFTKPIHCLANADPSESDAPVHGLMAASPFPVVLVDREQLRWKGPKRYFRAPCIQPLLAQPTPPPVTDYSKGKGGQKIVYPMLGNDQYGDCYYVALCKKVIAWTGQFGVPASFNTQQVVTRYLQLSGGDNGLSDSDVFPEFKSGILGPNGPHKSVDELLIDPNDAEAMAMGIWRFTGVMFTFAVYSRMMNNATPGATWDRSVLSGGIVGGHAVIFTGKNAKAKPGYDLQTWALDPPVNITPDCISGCDPESIVTFSTENYDPVTRKSAAGFTWEEDRQLWILWGGKDVGPAPWVDPVPVPPVPVPPSPPSPPVPPPTPPPVYPTYDVSTVGTITIPGFHFGPFQTVDVPSRTFTINSTGTGVPQSPHFHTPKAVNWPVIAMDAFMLYMAIQSKNPQMIQMAIEKLIADLGIVG